MDASPVAEDDDLALTSLGRALMDALRDDDRFRGILDDPFEEDAAGAA